MSNQLQINVFMEKRRKQFQAARAGESWLETLKMLWLVLLIAVTFDSLLVIPASGNNEGKYRESCMTLH